MVSEFQDNGNEVAPPNKGNVRKDKDNGDSDDAMPKPKRAKYAAVACDACKKRKAKCMQEGAGSTCRRCQSYEIDCAFSQGLPSLPDVTVDDRFGGIETQMATLQRQMGMLQNELSVLRSHDARHHARTAQVTQTPNRISEGPNQSGHHGPSFVGRTRPAFSFDVARSSLKDMGITSEKPAFSNGATPEPENHDTRLPPQNYANLQDGLRKNDMCRLLNVYAEEVHPVYPFVYIPALRNLVNLQAEESLLTLTADSGGAARTSDDKSMINTMLLRIVLAIGKVIESLGANDTSRELVDSVEAEISGLSNDDATHEKVSILAIMSVYYFHTDKELLAWRKIGVAARMSMEMGYHRKESLITQCSDPGDQSQLVNLFWCVYVLDRRWSFGTSLPFAIQDGDIDPELPEPDESAEYLRCMVKYGRICSKIWHAFPSFGSPTQGIPRDTVSYLDFQIQRWRESIPEHLRLGDIHSNYQGPNKNNRVPQRLQALLYLRGNYARILINRHHLMSMASIRADPISAQRVVDLATDSIRVLVELNETTEIYLRQQVAFNYFLTSALAVVFLAVCHDRATFGMQCKDIFYAAVGLIRFFSVRSHISRRLWKSVKGLLPEARKLGLHSDEEAINRPTPKTSLTNDAYGTTESRMSGVTGFVEHHPGNQEQGIWLSSLGAAAIDPMLETPFPDFNQISQDFTDWYETFGLPYQTDYGQLLAPAAFDNAIDTFENGLEFSKLLQDLISG